jgi:hypothetical protein
MLAANRSPREEVAANLRAQLLKGSRGFFRMSHSAFSLVTLRLAIRDCDERDHPNLFRHIVVAYRTCGKAPLDPISENVRVDFARSAKFFVGRLPLKIVVGGTSNSLAKSNLGSAFLAQHFRALSKFGRVGHFPATALRLANSLPAWL